MKKFRFALSILLLSGMSQSVSAQYYFYDDKYYDNPVTFELGGSIGIMNCLTDIGGKKGIGKKFIKDLNMNQNKFAGSVFVSATYLNAAALRLEATFGEVGAEDKVLAKVKETTYGRYDRNLSFKSRISEFSALAELHPFYIFGHYDDELESNPPRLSPYLLGGVGVFTFNPQTKIGNNWIDLQPLSTEGQGFAEYPDRLPYKLTQMNFPFGLGLRYELSDLFNVRAEFVYRKLNTDYLDDVSTTYINPALYSKYFTGSQLNNALLLNDRQTELSARHTATPGAQRGTSTNNDAYFSFNIKASIILGRERIK